MQIIESKNKYLVIEDGKILGEFETNREAWRFFDIKNGELLNRQQATSDWYFTKVFREP